MNNPTMRMKALRAYVPAPQERSIVRVLDLVLERLGQYILKAEQAQQEQQLAALHQARSEALKLSSGLGQVCRNTVEADPDLGNAVTFLERFASQLCLKLIRAGKRDSTGREWTELLRDIDALRTRLRQDTGR